MEQKVSLEQSIVSENVKWPESPGPYDIDLLEALFSGRPTGVDFISRLLDAEAVYAAKNEHVWLRLPYDIRQHQNGQFGDDSYLSAKDISAPEPRRARIKGMLSEDYIAE